MWLTTGSAFVGSVWSILRRETVTLILLPVQKDSIQLSSLPDRLWWVVSGIWMGLVKWWERYIYVCWWFARKLCNTCGSKIIFGTIPNISLIMEHETWKLMVWMIPTPKGTTICLKCEHDKLKPLMGSVTLRACPQLVQELSPWSGVGNNIFLMLKPVLQMRL